MNSTEAEFDLECQVLGDSIRAIWVAERSAHDAKFGIRSDWGARHMPQWDGGETASGRRAKPVWPKIAAFCLAHGIDPEVLIKLIFDDWGRSVPPPPNVAHGDYALKRYEEYRKKHNSGSARELVAIGFESQKAQARIAIAFYASWGLPREKVWRLGILGDAQPLSVLFRYCLAKSENFEDLANEFKDKALMQYLSDVESYDVVWGDWIPQELKDAAKGVTDRFRVRRSRRGNEKPRAEAAG